MKVNFFVGDSLNASNTELGYEFQEFEVGDTICVDGVSDYQIIGFSKEGDQVIALCTFIDP